MSNDGRAPAMMAAVPPAQGGIQMLGIPAPRLPRPLIAHGIITNLNDMEDIWHHTFYRELKDAPEEHPVLPTDPKAYRERMTQTRFETFNVPARIMATPIVLYVSGRTTDVSHTVPIYESYTLHHTILRVADRDLTEYLMKNLTDRGYSFTFYAERELARDVKEKPCCICLDLDTEHKSTAEMDKVKAFEPPDANCVTVGAKRFRCVERLSTTLPSTAARSVTLTSARRPTSSQTETPSMSALNASVALKCFLSQASLVTKASGVHDTPFQSNMKRDVYIRRELHANVVWSSGTTMFREIVERITNESTALVPFTTKIKVVAPSM